MVFQQFNLFPHLSVMDNLTLAPVMVREVNAKVATEAGSCHSRTNGSRR